MKLKGEKRAKIGVVEGKKKKGTGFNVGYIWTLKPDHRDLKTILKHRVAIIPYIRIFKKTCI